jgi:hypothetical protein
LQDWPEYQNIPWEDQPQYQDEPEVRDTKRRRSEGPEQRFEQPERRLDEPHNEEVEDVDPVLD